MKKLFDAANRYIKTCDWTTIAVLKFCLISLGMIIGMVISEKHRKQALLSAFCVFLVTYIPLMGKFYMIFTEQE